MELLWVSSKVTSLTEANLVFGLASVLGSEGYYCYLDVPFYDNIGESEGKGRYDLVALASNLSSLLIIEVKTDIGNWEEEISYDFRRLQNFKPTNFPYLTDKVKEKIKDIYIFSFHWTEDIAKRDRLGYENFGFGRISFEWRMIQEIIFEPDYNQKYFILGIGKKL
ncbi:hypothetical protein CH378_18100 [Leptospira kmetyi]|uniref:NERD domain-containing protein n=2 Tax=Leptospira kmetyi TaxID=408139 RepID=A0ABX4N506_9LEPT|nr:hypothetical protein CH378_18100 [Leptospira kmetyi]